MDKKNFDITHTVRTYLRWDAKNRTHSRDFTQNERLFHKVSGAIREMNGRFAWNGDRYILPFSKNVIVHRWLRENYYRKQTRARDLPRLLKGKYCVRESIYASILLHDAVRASRHTRRSSNHFDRYRLSERYISYRLLPFFTPHPGYFRSKLFQ